MTRGNHDEAIANGPGTQTMYIDMYIIYVYTCVLRTNPFGLQLHPVRCLDPWGTILPLDYAMCAFMRHGGYDPYVSLQACYL